MVRLIVVTCSFAICAAACGGGSGHGDSGLPGAADASSTADASLTPDAPPASDGAPLGDAGANAAVGDPCQKTANCSYPCSAVGCSTLCLTSQSFTGGYCSVQIPECPASGPAVCPAGSTCVADVQDGTNGDYCLSICTKDAQCRTADGYTCCAGLTFSGKSVCAPASLCP